MSYSSTSAKWFQVIFRHVFSVFLNFGHDLNITYKIIHILQKLNKTPNSPQSDNMATESIPAQRKRIFVHDILFLARTFIFNFCQFQIFGNQKIGSKF